MYSHGSFSKSRILVSHISQQIEGEDSMPTISMFYGILILMFFRDAEKHHVPHIHADY